MKKHLRATAALFAVLLLLLPAFSACSPKPGGLVDSVLLYVGIDAHDYEGENVTETLDPHGDFARSLADTVCLLTLDSTTLQEFSDSKSLPELYTDQLLTNLLNSRYSKYSGNPALLEQIAEEYSGFYATTIIPAADFDALIRTSFGGGANISHPDGKIFRYLSKAGAYVTEAQPIKNTVEIEILSCEATERTYRLAFHCRLGETVSPDYLAIFVKREDEEPYLKSLSERRG